jgi:Putative redox-active protein (C_GCAxxG_C_C).
MYGFYGWETADIRCAGGLTPRGMYDLLCTVWCEETCAPRLRAGWSLENRTLGQCSITAFLVQDLFGGKVYGVPLTDGSVHCFNEAGGHVFDLTSEQFGDLKIDYEVTAEQFREEHFLSAEKKERYLLLRKRFLAEYAVLLKQSCNCCQAVLCAYADETGLSVPKSVGAAFGLGMGGMEATCGALCGAELILGLKRYQGKPIRQEAKALHESFRARCGAVLCKDLKGIETGIVLCPCNDCVRNAVLALEEL